ncbi:hypothetical protein [Corynebacterium uterequi]|uniref:Uncharacterized protein n=1 Tax=Corynebacterium uterequi TaxID=1072256 RepID=A0A0G3HCD9_9CORY|nr:hypothetical protein [Corynebacterium uterequi]AKK11051.1 hypothetical protein CUTER_05270 [Corynebacterium uterequi]
MNRTHVVVIVGIMMTLVVTILVLIGTQRYMNAQEIELLVESAHAAGEEYQLTVHNFVTLDYSFETLTGPEQGAS